MLERYTEKSITVMKLAKEEARRLGHNLIGTEVILLGLIGEGTGIAAEALKAMGVSHKQGRARAAVEKIIGRGPGLMTMEMLFTPRAARLLVLATDEADKLESKNIGTHHVLLGLIREANESVEVETRDQVLQSFGVDLEDLRKKVFDIVQDYQEQGLKHPTKALW